MSSLFQDSRLVLQSVTLHTTVARKIVWGAFPGSVIHGALGYTLKKMNCVREDGDCEACFLVDRCPYGVFIETRASENATRMRKYPRVPSPLRIVVQPWQASVLKEGEQLDVTLVLIGQAVHHAVPVLMALRNAFMGGIGRKNRDGLRGISNLEFLQDTITNERLLWDLAWFKQGLPFEPHKWFTLAEKATRPDLMTFRTPTRIMAGGKIQRFPTFRDLISALTRRITNLAVFHAGIEIVADFKTIIQDAEVVHTPSDLRRIRADRFSGRQKARFQIDGITGTLDLHTVPDSFLPWLYLGRWLGVGKGTTMGFGEYTLETNAYK